jgi:hypothetical protein
VLVEPMLLSGGRFANRSSSYIAPLSRMVFS